MFVSYLMNFQNGLTKKLFLNIFPINPDSFHKAK